MKIASSGDWHIGLRNGSAVHHQDLLDFTHFLIENCKRLGVDTFVHTGDFFDNRSKIDVQSLNVSQEIVNLLTENFKRVIMIKGNHDILLRDSRKTSSLNIFRNKVELVEDYIIDNDIMYCSWVCNQQEYDEIIKVSKKKKIKYMFAHMEFSGFVLNQNYIMEHGHTHKELKHIKKIISGHYHTKQIKDNVIYNGSPFPMDYSNSNENDLGFSILDTELNEVEFILYDKIKILSFPVKEFLNKNSIIDIPDKTSIRVIIDEEISDIELLELQNRLTSSNLRDTKIIYKLEKDSIIEKNEATTVSDIKTLDEIIIDHLSEISDTKDIDKDILIDIFKRAMNDNV